MLALLVIACLLAFVPASAQVPRFEAGLALYHQGKFRAALDELEASEKTGEPATARQFYQGVCLAKVGDWRQASSRLSSYVEAQPSDAHGWYWLSRTQLFQKKFSDARKSVQRAIDLDDKSAEAYKVMGEIELEIGNPDGAYRAWLTANKLDSRDAQITYYLGRLFYEGEILKEAAAWFRETLRLEPKHFGAMTYLGLCVEHEGEDDEAVGLYRAALTESKLQNKPFSWAFLSYGKFLRQHGNASQAISILEEGERTCPEAHLLSALGQALAAERQTSRAEAVLRRAIEMDPSISEAHYRLSLLLRAGGRIEQAEIELQKFQEAKRVEQQNSNKISVIRK